VSIPLEPVTIGAGAGFEEASTDAVVLDDSWNRWMWYVNVLYSFTDNFTIIPEIQFQDLGDNYSKVDEGSMWAVGARLQADF
jgi:hypothetical protein